MGIHFSIPGASTFDPANPGAIGATTPAVGTFTRLGVTSNGAASAPVMSVTGTPFTGGTSTTTKPLMLIEPIGSTSNNWSTSGTMLGVNVPAGFAGDALRLQSDASPTTHFRVSLSDGDGAVYFGPQSAGLVIYASSLYPSPANNLRLGTTTFSSGFTGLSLTSGADITWGTDLLLFRAAAASLQLGTNHATTPTAQAIKAHDVTTGTGAALTLQGGSGSVARGNVVLDGGNRSAYIASPSATQIRDILISHGLMAAS